MIISVGEILFDLFPQGRQLGGAPFNFAFHLKQLGLPVRFISRVGRDDMGREIHDILNQNGFDTEDVPMDSHHPTGTVTVALEEGEPQYTITPEVAWDYLEWNAQFNDAPAFLYFGTLAQRTPQGQAFIKELVRKMPDETRIFADINLRPGSDDPGIIQSTLDMAHILKLNGHELFHIWSISLEGPRLAHAVRHQMQRHNLDLVILTLGPRGSLWVTQEESWPCNAVPLENPENTVGAGDAFAAVCIAGMIQSLHPRQILARASAFATQICTGKGALPDHPGAYTALKQNIGVP